MLSMMTREELELILQVILGVHTTTEFETICKNKENFSEWVCYVWYCIQAKMVVCPRIQVHWQWWFGVTSTENALQYCACKTQCRVWAYHGAVERMVSLAEKHMSENYRWQIIHKTSFITSMQQLYCITCWLTEIKWKEKCSLGWVSGYSPHLYQRCQSSYCVDRKTWIRWIHWWWRSKWFASPTTNEVYLWDVRHSYKFQSFGGCSFFWKQWMVSNAGVRDTYWRWWQ